MFFLCKFVMHYKKTKYNRLWEKINRSVPKGNLLYRNIYFSKQIFQNRKKYRLINSFILKTNVCKCVCLPEYIYIFFFSNKTVCKKAIYLAARFRQRKIELKKKNSYVKDQFMFLQQAPFSTCPPTTYVYI